MILSYTERLQNILVTELVEKELDDSVISLNERISQNNVSGLSSGKAFILLVDCRGHPPLSLCSQLELTALSGSKILYCLFFSRRLSDGVDTMARRFTDDKKMVLFGYDSYLLNKDGALSGEELSRLSLRVKMMRDCRPFTMAEGISFPYRNRQINQNLLQQGV